MRSSAAYLAGGGNLLHKGRVVSLLLPIGTTAGNSEEVPEQKYHISTIVLRGLPPPPLG